MTLAEIKQLISEGRYQYFQKVSDLLEEGYFDIDDMVHCILSATAIYKKERDERGEAIHNMQYVIFGKDTHGQPFYTAGKVRHSREGYVYFYITAHAAE
jgi:hypothetical protein